MSFTKGFWVTIIILTLNQQQDTQRTAWARWRAERGGINHPQLMLPPSRSSPTCHCHSDPDSQIKPSRKTPGPFGQLNTKMLPEAVTKHTPAFECRGAGRCRARGSTERWLHRFHSSPAPAPTQHRQLQFSLRLPRRQKLKTRFHWSTAWISWIPLLSTFSAFPGMNTVKQGRRGGGGGMWGSNPVPPLWPCQSKQRLQRHWQRGSNRKDYSYAETSKYVLNISLGKKESTKLPEALER